MRIVVDPGDRGLRGQAWPGWHSATEGPEQAALLFYLDERC